MRARDHHSQDDALFHLDPVHNSTGRSGPRASRLWFIRDFDTWQPRSRVNPNQGDLLAEAGRGAMRDETPRSRRIGVRYVRDAGIVRELKDLYDNRCQVCDTTLRGRGGLRRSDAAHIRALAYNGPDRQDNLLCLCANHHGEFDLFGIHITDTGTVRVTDTREVVGPLRVLHTIDLDHLRYHRAKCGVDTHPDVGELPPPRSIRW